MNAQRSTEEGTVQERPWVVLKFGGTSVSSRERWQTIAEVVTQREEEGLRPLVVCSAVGGISRMLDRLLDAAVRGAHQPVLDEVRARHETLAETLGVDAGNLLEEYYDELDRLGRGVSLTQEISPRLRARGLSTGELMSTTLGAAFLREQGLDVRWYDARELLQAEAVARRYATRRYLEATCVAEPDPTLQRTLGDDDAVPLTQGFIARDYAGDTVLLGWGGSDTSAAYFAARVEAQRLEIWTDVPGMFTTNPRLVPTARHLRNLSYDEAQELATTGAEVLHPRCIDPARRLGIPIHIRCTLAPHLEGTVVAGEATGPPMVKALSPKKGITCISIDTVEMWQQVGFLADVFRLLKDHNLSADLIATSETNVTFSLDRTADALDAATVESLLHELSHYGDARAIGPCAAVSLVGHRLRSVLHELAPALRLAGEHPVHIMTQAASDINLTFVVDEAAADAFTRELHAALFGGREEDELLGATWETLFA